MAKFKIDEKWNGVILNNGVEYLPGEIFSADKSLGENRPWLIPQPASVKISEKAKDEIKLEEEKPETKVEAKGNVK